MLFNTAAQLTKRLYYLLWLGPRGYGKPLPKDTLESQYHEGYFASMDTIDELSHYMVIVGYIHRLHQSPAILDVGCGPGYLVDLLSAFGFKSYLGMDLSSTAIKRAESLSIMNARFEIADYQEWEASDRFDIIIFNESLVYAKRPVDIVLRYGGWLKENGSIIISMYRYGYHGAIWRSLNKCFAVTNSTTVKNQQGQVWDIKVLRPKAL